MKPKPCTEDTNLISQHYVRRGGRWELCTVLHNGVRVFSTPLPQPPENDTHNDDVFGQPVT